MIAPEVLRFKTDEFHYFPSALKKLQEKGKIHCLSVCAG